MSDERSRILQIMPCEPGWRVLRAYRKDGVTHASIDPVLMWALVACNEDVDRPQKYDFTYIEPVVLGDQTCGEIEVAVRSGRDFVGLLKPGDLESDWSDEVECHLDCRDRLDAARRAERVATLAQKSEASS